NYESKYLRNRVRLKLIPQLKIYNLNIKEILLQTVMLLTEDYLYFERKVNEAFADLIQKQTENSIELNALGIRDLELSVQGHIIRAAIERVKGNLSEIAFSHIHNIIKNLESTEMWAIHLPDKIYAFGQRNTLVITNDKPKLPERISYIYKLSIPGELFVEEVQSRITAEIIERPKNFKLSDYKNNTAVMDFEEVGKELVVRSRKEGDRFIPLGMRGTKKVHDYLIDQKVPLEERDYIPIVEAEKRIVWLAGHRIDERVKVKKKTQKLLKLTAQKA
ncbi:MAG: tRNA lysidine(34) synthetase TilS, partial [Candidatus Margulisiibacteriota bacterium]